jgi:hypothetical protein
MIVVLAGELTGNESIHWYCSWSSFFISQDGTNVVKASHGSRAQYLTK